MFIEVQYGGPSPWIVDRVYQIAEMRLTQCIQVQGRKPFMNNTQTWNKTKRQWGRPVPVEGDMGELGGRHVRTHGTHMLDD